MTEVTAAITVVMIRESLMIFPARILWFSRYLATKTLAEGACCRLARGPNIPNVLKIIPYSPNPSLPRKRAKKIEVAIGKIRAETAPTLFQKAPFRNLLLIDVGSRESQYLLIKAGLLELKYSSNR